MFIFLLTPFDTRDSHYFRSNVSLVLLINIVGTPPPPYPKIESLGGGGDTIVFARKRGKT